MKSFETPSTTEQFVGPQRAHAGEHRGDEELRIGRLRVVEHPVGQAALDHLALLHHQNPVRQQTRDGEIVRDQHDREPHVGDEAAQQIEQPRLDRDVEAAGRLVHEDQAGRGDEIARDLQALPHAAGIGRRRIVEPARRRFRRGPAIPRRRRECAP